MHIYSDLVLVKFYIDDGDNDDDDDDDDDNDDGDYNCNDDWTVYMLRMMHDCDEM